MAAVLIVYATAMFGAALWRGLKQTTAGDGAALWSRGAGAVLWLLHFGMGGEALFGRFPVPAELSAVAGVRLVYEWRARRG